VKFYTKEGNWDLVGNQTPVFFIRDAIKFPDFIHAMKPSPVTNVQDANRVFDFLSSQPWATNMLTYVYGKQVFQPATANRTVLVFTLTNCITTKANTST
jgi:catalase